MSKENIVQQRPYNFVVVDEADRYSLTHLLSYLLTHLTIYSLTHLTIYSLTQHPY